MKIRHLLPLLILLLIPWTAAGYERIVSLKPNVTEILFALGVGNKVVGVTNYCKYPPEAQKLPKIGGYSTPSLEKILSLQPDLVILIPESTSPKLEEAIRYAGIETLVVHSATLAEIYDAIQTIATKMNISEKGQKLVESMQYQIEELRQNASHSGEKALIVVQRRPLIVAGGQTFLGESLTLAGLDNIAGSSKLPYPRIGLDLLISKKPQVIFDLDPTPSEGYWDRFQSIPAVRSRSIWPLSPDLFVPGPRFPEALAKMVEALKEH